MEPTRSDVPPKPSVRPPTGKLAVENDYPTARLSGIQFGLLTNRDVIRLSVIEKAGITKCPDLFDARLGVPNKDQKCTTCNGTRRGACNRPDSCDGHFGHIVLPQYIYHPHFIRKCVKILSMVCLGCGRILQKKKRKNILEDIFAAESDDEGERDSLNSEMPAPKQKVVAGISRKRKRAEKGSDLARLLMGELERGVSKQECEPSLALDSANPGFPQAQLCKLEPTEITGADLSAYPSELPDGFGPGLPASSNAGKPKEPCKHCGGPNGVGSTFPKIKLRVVAKQIKRKSKVDTIQMYVDQKVKELPPKFWEFVRGHPINNGDKTRTLVAFECLDILRKIPEEDLAKLNMERSVARPDSFVIHQTLVSPNCNRLVMEDWSSTLQPRVLQRRSGQTNKLEALVRKAKRVQETKAPEIHDIQNDSEELQLLVAKHFRACKVVEYKMSTGKEVEETGGTLELKWLKDNVLAKRQNFCARTVINGDPWIGIDEIGIPQEIAQRLTVDEKVNRWNIRNWQKAVDDYMVSDNTSMPGAFVLRKHEAHHRDLELLRTKNQKLKIKVAIGDIITRGLKDGDSVIANRPPSVHRHSLITLKVKVHGLSTIAINPLICAPFEADFDGDSFHIFVPQSLESKAELQELMSVPAQLISSQGGQPLIGLTQDSLTASHLLTSGHVFLDRENMEQLAMWCPSGIPMPAIVKAPAKTGPLWTGKQLFSMTLPDGLAFGSLSWTGTPLGMRMRPRQTYTAEGDVLIKGGELLICQGGSKWLERSPHGVVRAVADHAGPEATVQHLDCLQAVLNQWLLIRGFSVGLHDFYAAEDTGARKRMLRGVQKSLEKSNDASLKQALRLDRQVQHRILSPARRPEVGSSGGVDEMEEHQGCFGLLLGEGKSTPRVAALQGAAIERFQALSPVVENLVSGYMDQKNALLTMVRSGAKGSMAKLTQQVGCNGLHFYKGEKLLPVRRNSKLSYLQTNVEKDKSHVFRQTKADEEGFWESRGIIRSSFLDGLNVRELFLDTISSRCNVLRSGVEEPNLILKNLMLFLRDMKIEYDGTVRLGRGRSIIQFQYGTGDGCSLDTDPNPPAPSSGSSNSSLVSEAPVAHWPNSKLAGEPVGALAATSITEPAYNVKMQSIHQAQVLGIGPVQLLKETMMGRSKTKLKLNDRRCILRLPDGFGKERRALDIQNQLQNITLEKLTLACSIEFAKLDRKLYVKLDKDPLKSKPFLRMSPWMGHLQLCKKTVDENKLSVPAIVERLNWKHTSKGAEDLQGVYFSYSDSCRSDVHPQCRGLCIWFFPVMSPAPATLMSTNKAVNQEKMALLLESIKSTMLPAVLSTTIRGSEKIEKVRIFWEDSGAASRLPRECTQLTGQHSLAQLKRADPGELAIEVVVKAPKGGGQRGAAWLAVKEACVPVLDMIDWRRSTPYAIQEIYKGYGVEAARHMVLQRLTLASKNMGHPTHAEHMMLVADTMTHCGDVTGLGSAGYRDFCRNMSISAPFTEAAFQHPKKNFLDAAAGGASETIDGALTYAVWGRRVPLGTGTGFETKPQTHKIKSLQPGDPLDMWEELMEPKALRRKKMATQKVSLFKKSLKSENAFQNGKQTGGVIEMLDDLEGLTGTGIFQDGKLAGIMLEKGHGKDVKATIMLGKGKDVKATIFQYEDDEEELDDDIPENVEDQTTDLTLHNDVLDDGKEADHDLLPAEQTTIPGPALQSGKRKGCNGTAERGEHGSGVCATEKNRITERKRALERPDEAAESCEPLCKFQRKDATSNEGNVAALRVESPRRVTSPGCADGDTTAAEERKADCTHESPEFRPHISAEEASEGRPAQATVRGATTSAPRKVSPNLRRFEATGSGGDLSPVPSPKRIWSGAVNMVRAFFGSKPGRNSQGTEEQDMEEDPHASRDLGGGDAERARGLSQSSERQVFPGQKNMLLPPKNGSTIGPIQLERVANSDELLINRQKTKLQHILHDGRYRAGERLAADVEKMILEEVLVHHPNRTEKIGCGVDYVQVDYHPDYPSSKCFHIVRKDGTRADFSYHKCLDTKLSELNNSKTK